MARGSDDFPIHVIWQERKEDKIPRTRTENEQVSITNVSGLQFDYLLENVVR